MVDCYNNDIEKTLINLSNPRNSGLCFGFEDFDTHSDLLSFKNYYNMVYTCLIKLCVSLGLLRLFNPEGGEKPDLFKDDWDIEYILLKLDDYFGFRIDFPDIFEKSDNFEWVFYVNYYKDLQNAGIDTKEKAEYHYNNYGKQENRQCNGEFGINSSRGIIKIRSVHSLYFMSRIKETIKNNITQSTILEIGGGLGRNAYYARKLGIAKYIIIDLPSTFIMSSYYLGKTLGEENITLFGENSNNYVHILPPNCYTDNTDVDIVVQFDGLTEMGMVNSNKYVSEFSKISPLFLSINHEANKYTVNDLYKNNKNICCVYRFKSWYRDGYVEELLKRNNL